jgi:hypothetical protein
VIIAFVMGIVMWARYYIPTAESQTLQDEFGRWVRIIAGFAAILGILSVIHYHSTKIRNKRPGFGFSWVTLTAFTIMALAGFLPMAFPGFAQGQVHGDGLHQWLYDNMMLPMQATMFSCLAFFIASAAFRAFRARSAEATALLIAACLMMIGRVPIGDWLQAQNHFLIFPDISSWLLNVPNAASSRGILLGVLLSQVAIAVRIIFGIERTYMGGGD